MVGKGHVILTVLLITLIVVAMGIPHGDSDWFSWYQPEINERETQDVLLYSFRIPRLIMAIVAGAALSISGLLLQTLFDNPLAGPSILGLTSGAHLFVALAVLGTGIFSTTLSTVGITVSAGLGALTFGLFILLIAARVRQQLSLLLIGMMLGTFVSALTSVLLAKADPNAIKSFTMWSFGSLIQVNMSDIPLIVILTFIGIIGSFLLVKALDVMVLGERQAGVLGISVQRTQWFILIVTALLTGLVTAFCGPIAFVGLVVPNLVKLFYRTQSHRLLLLGCVLFGASFLVFCDLIVVCLEPYMVLPINTLTSLVGAPVVIVLLLKRKSHA